MQDLLDDMDSTKKQVLRFRWWVLFIYFFIFFIGNGFRIMHWPFSIMLMIIGAGGFMAYSLSFLILIRRKTPFIIISNLLSFSWLLFIAWAIIFNYGHPLNEIGLLVQLATFSILFVIHFFTLLPLKRSRKKKLSN